MGKAIKAGLLQVDRHQIRDYSQDKHRTVDDTPYGGGEGMLLKVDVLHRAWMGALQKSFGITATRKEDLVGNESAKVCTILLSPQGRVLDQEYAKELVARGKKLVLVCGHYEGVDERFIDLCVDEELSIGDYILTGGEFPALVVADAVVRLLPGALGNERSVSEESLEGDLLKNPVYTRPPEFLGKSVPEVLLAGHHGKVDEWRRVQKETRTKARRPDLWARYLAKAKSR